MTSHLMVVLEGGDACGKETQAQLLQNHESLAVEGQKPSLYAFPRYRSQPVGPVIGASLEGVIDVTKNDQGLNRHHAHEVFLQSAFIADRYMAASEICNDLHHRNVICDRWTPSGSIYGAVYNKGTSAKWIAQAQQMLPGEVYGPEVHALYILLDVPFHIASARRKIPQDRYEAERDKRMRIRGEYLAYWEQKQSQSYPHAKMRYHYWEIVDGSQSPQQITDEILRLVRQYKDEVLAQPPLD